MLHELYCGMNDILHGMNCMNCLIAWIINSMLYVTYNTSWSNWSEDFAEFTHFILKYCSWLVCDITLLFEYVKYEFFRRYLQRSGFTIVELLPERFCDRPSCPIAGIQQRRRDPACSLTKLFQDIRHENSFLSLEISEE